MTRSIPGSYGNLAAPAQGRAAARAWPAGAAYPAGPAAGRARAPHQAVLTNRPGRGAGQPGRAYRVQPGDTLSSITQRFYGRRGRWSGLYEANRFRVRDPDQIYPGQILTIPAHLPAPPPAASHQGSANHPARKSLTITGSVPQAAGPETPRLGKAPASEPAGERGPRLGCAGLETLWRQAGGSASAALTAASIAMAESSGDQYATGAAGERGYWQINPVNGPLATYNPYGNARAAVIMSADGTNWSPWTTYTSGAYAGRCRF